MTRAVIFHRLAVRDYRTAIAWYRKSSSAASMRFRDEIDRMIEEIRIAPEQGGAICGPYRWIRARRYPYLLYYKVVDTQVIRVYAVAHARRKPDYWLRRTL